MNTPNTIPWPPIIYITAIGAGFLLQKIMPLPWPELLDNQLFNVFGILLIICALALDVSAILTLRKNNTTVMPHRAASHLVTSGPFQFSRNPIYLGNTLIVIGLGLVFELSWLIVCALIAALITNEWVIKREEAHLEHKFGKAWQEYCRKVRRWF